MSRKLPRLTAALISTALLTLLATAGSAHELEPQRSIVAEVDDTSLSLMVVYEEVPGPRSDLLRARYDLNGDGKIEGQEAMLASREMIARMLAGLQFEVEHDRPGGHSPEIRFQIGPKGEVSAAAFIRYNLSTLSEIPLPASRKLHIRLHPSTDNIPTEVAAIARPGLQIQKIFQPPGTITQDGASLLTAGQQWTAVFVIAPDDESATPTPNDTAALTKE